MDNKAMLIIAAVAIIVVAGVCVYFFANNGDSTEKVEVYRDLVEGDTIDFVSDAEIDYVGEPSLSTADKFLGGLYYDGIATGERAKVTINSTEYDCTIVQLDGSKSAVYVLDSGFKAKAVNYLGDMLLNTKTITKTDLDPSKGIDEQVVKKGTYYEMEFSMPLPAFGHQMMLEGTYKRAVDSIEDGSDNIMVKSEATLGGGFKLHLEIESIVDGIVTFKGVEQKISYDEAMLLISYDHLKKHLESEYTVAYGEKSSKKIETEFGKREVTCQQIKFTDTHGHSRTIDADFGAENVLYSYSAVITGFNVDDAEVDLRMTYTLYGSTAVTTEKV